MSVSAGQDSTRKGRLNTGAAGLRVESPAIVSEKGKLSSGYQVLYTTSAHSGPSISRRITRAPLVLNKGDDIVGCSYA
jgi:hypothetical protein